MKATIDVTLVEATCDMMVEKGARLMIIGDACVGIYTGRLPTEHIVHAPLPSKMLTAPTHKRDAKGVSTDRKKNMPSRTANRALSSADRKRLSGDLMIETIRNAARPVTTQEIADIVGVGRDDLAGRAHVSFRVRELRIAGKIIAEIGQNRQKYVHRLPTEGERGEFASKPYIHKDEAA